MKLISKDTNQALQLVTVGSTSFTKHLVLDIIALFGMIVHLHPVHADPMTIDSISHIGCALGNRFS
jgi:hypothetical protein